MCGEGSNINGGLRIDAWVSDCSLPDPYLDVEGVNAIIDDMSPHIIDCCPDVCGVLLVGAVC